MSSLEDLSVQGCDRRPDILRTGSIRSGRKLDEKVPECRYAGLQSRSDAACGVSVGFRAEHPDREAAQGISTTGTYEPVNIETINRVRSGKN